MPAPHYAELLFRVVGAYVNTDDAGLCLEWRDATDEQRYCIASYHELPPGYWKFGDEVFLTVDRNRLVQSIHGGSAAPEVT